MIVEKSRTDERREVWEIIAIGQEHWCAAPRVIRSALAYILLKRAKKPFFSLIANKETQESHREVKKKKQLNVM